MRSNGLHRIHKTIVTPMDGIILAIDGASEVLGLMASDGRFAYTHFIQRNSAYYHFQIFIAVFRVRRAWSLWLQFEWLILHQRDLAWCFHHVRQAGFLWNSWQSKWISGIIRKRKVVVDDGVGIVLRRRSRNPHVFLLFLQETAVDLGISFTMRQNVDVVDFFNNLMELLFNDSIFMIYQYFALKDFHILWISLELCLFLGALILPNGLDLALVFYLLQIIILERICNGQRRSSRSNWSQRQIQVAQIGTRGWAQIRVPVLEAR